MSAGDIDLGEVDRDHEDLLLIAAGFSQDLAGRAGDETLAPKLQAIPADGLFEADPISDGHITTIGDRVTALHDFPGAMLVDAVLGLLFGMPANRGGVKKNFRSLHGGQASGFGIPLVPTDQYADFAVPGGS